jgi:hypothetical protein
MRKLSLPQTHQPGCEDLSHLIQSLVRVHEIGRQRIAARKAVIEVMGSDPGVLVHPAARSRYSVSLSGDGLASRLCSIQPRIVSGSLSS